ncbi:hypothetical protein, partial [Joostella sp. CR20]|uniref:hypothetical protein n=1 Tax=Joostella sp. CR20 TaxID=2804312 RepID=UPI00313E0430
MKRKLQKAMLYFLLLASAVQLYAHLDFEGIKKRDVNPFPKEAMFTSLSASATGATCSGNGSVSFEVTDAENGDLYDFSIRNSSNNNEVDSGSFTFDGTSFSHTKGQLLSGEYAVTVANRSNPTDVETSNVTVADERESIIFSLNSTVSCGGRDIEAIVTSGNVQDYRLLNSDLSVYRGYQASNVFTGVPQGNYIVEVRDVCGDSETQGITIPNTDYGFQFMRRNNVDGELFNLLSSCNEIYHIERVRLSGGAELPEALYPISVSYTVTGNQGTNINDSYVMNSSAENDREILIPFNNNGEALNYSITIVDACGKTVTHGTNFTAEKDFTLARAQGLCGGSYLRLDDFANIQAPYTIEFVDFPTGFDASDYSNDFTPGTNTATITDPVNVNTAFDIGNRENGVPDYDSYRVKITDACGEEVLSEPLKISTTIVLDLFASRIYNGCDFNEGSIRIYINNGTTSAKAADIEEMYIIEAPDAYKNMHTLPSDVSENVNKVMLSGNFGQFIMNSLPVGTYKFQAITSCGTTLEKEFTIEPTVLEYEITPKFNCNNYDLDASVTTNLASPIVFLQRYDETTGLWGHPMTDANEGNNDVVNENSGLQLLLFANNDGVQTMSTSVNNITTSGLFRVVLNSFEYENAVNSLQSCGIRVIEEYDIPTSGIALNNYYVYSCDDGTREIAIDAAGSAPLTYEITAKDGEPYSIVNGENPIFTVLEEATYTLEVHNGCGATRVFNISTNVLRSPRVTPQNLCEGQSGSLFVDVPLFYNVEWFKDGVSVGTGNRYSFASFDRIADAGTYEASIQTSDPTSCSNTTVSYEVSSTDDGLANAGTGQTITLYQGAVKEPIDLFNYVEGEYDDYGSWSETTATGSSDLLVDNVWDAQLAEEGEYTFMYTVDGSCGGTDATTVTIIIEEATADIVTVKTDNS